LVRTKNARLEQENKQEESFAALKKELEWVRSNAKGQQKKNKARMERFEELNSREFQQRNETSEIYIPPGPRLGNKVVEVEGISKSFDGRLLYENLSLLYHLQRLWVSWVQTVRVKPHYSV
jgi:ATPase subunit of ABC transporter with duplicated ATPase domains